jgi:EAL domain-containing protein (putative c-di-GMP-specific phosphodiesterase class I)
VPRAKLRLETELREALAGGQLELHYQPKIDIRSGGMHSAEALIRWRHPQRGWVQPADFIPFAEATGLIAPIGEWVVREACRQTRAWQDEGLPLIRVAVNLSPTQFRHGNLLGIMRQALDDARLDPRHLEVELTESTVMSDAEGSVKILEQLSQMGVLVSVDDFGTGYSSMSYLRRFPVDKLKIDRTFIQDIVSCPDDASIVRAIISLAHSLRLKVVAEGVETREQLEFLESLDCDQYQGYLCSPAVPPLEFARLLANSAGRSAAFQNEALRTHSKLAAYRR